MELQMYGGKIRRVEENFGEYNCKSSPDFFWYFGKSRIGVVSNNSSRADALFWFFGNKNDKLILHPSRFLPLIMRKNRNHYANDEFEDYGRMFAHDSGVEQTSNLISMIRSTDTTHTFRTSIGDNKHVLTFSPKAPSSELYIPRHVVPVEIR
jgi:hypothetical protein